MKLAVAFLIFILADALVLFFVFRKVAAKGIQTAAGGEHIDVGQLVAFSKQIHEETGRWLQANYSGDPAQLPEAIHGLMELARTRATENGLRLDDDVLRKLVETSALHHHAGKAAEIRTALDRAA